MRILALSAVAILCTCAVNFSYAGDEKPIPQPTEKKVEQVTNAPKNVPKPPVKVMTDAKHHKHSNKSVKQNGKNPKEDGPTLGR